MATKKAKKKSKAAAKRTVKRVAKKTAVKNAPAKKPPARPKPTGLMADVQNLMEMMSAHEVTEIDIKDGVRKISLKRGQVVTGVVSAPVAAAMPVAVPAASAPAPATEATESAPADDLLEITSPMVGTFYAAQSPDSDPYVEVGAKVNAETVVCIVEAMKVMNEIKAEVSGTIVEVRVKNAEPVEFGQVMFRVKP
jgi:acetyl-CoA carboxylase biotin carboxyl carrier protein